ncbi:MAG: Glycosyltransferase AglJ [Methanomassiliicoccales archaeon PtaB.Bin215]|nr:MAG: Glycosyltransferase AglJ [Methanomassiliicoccales archaeon PtaB.Bin215]
MNDGPTNIVVLVPAFREELTISMVVTLSRKFADKVIVVDDGSPDRTSELALLAGAEVITMERNKGKAAALMVGFERCREINPKCTVMLDGDGQMDPALIPDVAAPILAGMADLVIGSRFISEVKANIPRYRVFGQKMLNRVTNIGSETKVTDSQSGFRALSARALQNMDFSSRNYNVESDMITHFMSRGLVIREVPITVRYDVPNGHKQKPISHGYSVLSRMISYIGYRRPLLLFGIPGAIFFFGGLIVIFASFLEIKVMFDWTLVTQSTAGITVFFLGIFLLFDAMILNSLSVLMDNLNISMGERKR